MILKDGFVTQESDGEQIMIAVGSAKFSGLVRSNKTAAFIVDCLKDETTESAIVDKMLEKYNADKAVLEKDVHEIVQKLRKIGAIDE